MKVVILLSAVVIIAGVIDFTSGAVVIPPQPEIPDLLLVPLQLLVGMASQWYQKNGNQCCIFYHYENFYYVSI